MQHTEQEILYLQRNNYDTDNMISYAWRINKYISPGDRVLDIGCGLGHQTYHIYQLKPQCMYILLDLDKVDLTNKKNYSSQGYPHNSLDLTKQFVHTKMNSSVIVQDVSLYEWNIKVDVVISTLSWGWHYPIDTYLDKVLVNNPKHIIFDTRIKSVTIPGYKCVDKFSINRKETTVVFKRL